MTDSPEDDSGLWFFQERSELGDDPDAQLSDSQETQRMPAVAPAPPNGPAQANPAARANAPASFNAAGQSNAPAQANAAQSVVDRSDHQAAQARGPQSPPAPWAQPPAARSEVQTVPTRAPGPIMPPPARPTDQPNLPRVSNPSFAVVRRGGYDKVAVDSYVAQQQHEAAMSAEQLRSAGREVARLQELVTDLENRLAEMETPTWSGLGSHAAALLRIAEDQATNVTLQAQQAADESRTRIEREAAALRADAEKEAADIRTVALQEMEQRRQSVLAEAEHTRALAASESGDLLAAAKREADQVKIAARQEATTLLQGAKREAEQARAAADREAAEARRILAVERERMTKESTDRHSTAAAETARLVEEAEARANAADERTRAAIETANRHREQSMAASEESLTRARREAEQLIASARKQAEQILSNATADVDRQLAAARLQLTTLQKRRDGIVTQLSQLRDLVSSFAQADDVLEEDSTGTPAQIEPPAGR